MSKIQSDRLKSELTDLAVELRDDVVPNVNTADADECELCSARSLERGTVEYDCRAERYVGDCPKHDCDTELGLWRLVVSVDNGFPMRRTGFIGVGCQSDCSISDAYLIELAENNDPEETQAYTVPMEGIKSSRICAHHTSYVPEVTMLVCASCHSKIHHNNEFRPDLQPDMKRADWERASGGGRR